MTLPEEAVFYGICFAGALVVVMGRRCGDPVMSVTMFDFALVIAGVFLLIIFAFYLLWRERGGRLES